MNLWVKRIGQLAIVSVALFFFSCQDESSLLGFRNPTSKFELGYVDIPVGSSVLLFDSIRTSNFNASNDVNRFLVGNYVDPVFGNTTASTYVQFVPLGKITTNVKDSVTLVYDSVSILLRFDFYVYGATGITKQTFHIHELEEELPISNSTSLSTTVGGQHTPSTVTLNSQRLYYGHSSTAYLPTPLGSVNHSVDFEKFNLYFKDGDPKTEYIRSTLDYNFGEVLFEEAVDADSTFTRPDLFTARHFGLAILPDLTSDKIVGFYPTDESTRIRIHYHSVHNKTGAVKDTLKFEFALNRVSYNKVVSDRSMSELSGLTTKYEEYAPTDTRYIQAATGVVTKLDLSKFMEFAQSDTIERLAINSAELLIKNVDAPAQFAPPKSLAVKILKDNNRIKKLTFPGKSSRYQADLDLLNLYGGRIGFDQASTSTYHGTAFDSTFTVMNDQNRFLTLGYSESDKKYSGTASLFFQQLFRLRDEDPENILTNVVLVPYEAATSATTAGRHINGKTLNRVSFNKDNIILRVYYTIPTVNQNQ